MSSPIAFRWFEGVMIPQARFARMAHEQYVVDETYILAEVQERSKKSHDHFFVLVDEAWSSLPESYDGRWATPDHLRKWALIKAGYRDERTLVCSSKAEALRLAAFVKQFDEYAVVTVREAVVTAYTARSQSLKAMGKTDFQESKTRVLEILGEMIGVTQQELARA